MVPMHYMRALAWDLAKRVTRDEEAATAVEYGIMVAAIAAIIILVVFALGRDILGAFNTVEDNIGGSQA